MIPRTFYERIKFDGFVKSRKPPFSVIPAKAEILMVVSTLRFGLAYSIFAGSLASVL